MGPILGKFGSSKTGMSVYLIGSFIACFVAFLAVIEIIKNLGQTNKKFLGVIVLIFSILFLIFSILSGIYGWAMKTF